MKDQVIPNSPSSGEPSALKAPTDRSRDCAELHLSSRDQSYLDTRELESARREEGDDVRRTFIRHPDHDRAPR